MKALLSSLIIAAALMGLMYFTGERPPASDLPDGWRLQDIHEAMPPNNPGGKTYVLAWKIEEDERPLRLEHCLALKHTEEPGGDRWVIACLYRQPTLRNLWQVAVRAAAPDMAFPERAELRQTEYFTSRPTNQQVYDFIDFVHWTFGADEDWKLIDGRVCEQTWTSAVGEKPTRDFAK
jgi:hypothetical protein